jgi:hypothetical protein
LRISGENYYIVGTDVNPYHIELNDLDQRYVIPQCNDPNYFSVLNEIIDKWAIDYVHPQPDIEVLAIAKNRDLIKGGKTFLPSYHSIEIAQDKFECNSLLHDSGIPVADSVKLFNKEQARTAISNLLRWNSKVWLRATHGAGSKAAVPIYHADEAHGWINIWRHRDLDFMDFMVSEYLPGQDFAFTSIWKEGELITSIVRQRVLYLLGFVSPSGQSSTPSVAVIVHNDKVNEIATNAILAIDPKPQGAYYVDLKENSHGIPCVTEINAGRFNATINFFAHAGINLPHLLIKLATNQEFPNVKKYDPVPKGQYWVRQIDMGYKLVKEGNFRAININGS